MIEWQWSSFWQLSAIELYNIMKARQEVFVVEQHCVYQDIDNLDKRAWHLIGWESKSKQQRLVAYLRVVYPGEKYTEASIGRVLTVSSARGTGLGKQLIAESLKRISDECSKALIRISAQTHLERFYANFGFKTVSEPYDEDGISHIEMLRNSV
ncbi:MAG: GNAT family N-acetyltransferase [Cellvibrionaceae bacterium]|nr:GNAT family N-acetyltransferase [Cellvibrionaceae bacterium]